MKHNFTVRLATGLLAATLIFFACEKEIKTATVNSTDNAASGAVAGKTGIMSTPTITCGSSTQTSITLRVCAGSTGAPAGFSIQWMTKDAFQAAGGVWPLDSSLYCKASFSGNANLSRYNLTANACVDVNLGEFLFDNGASTNCPDALLCGTTYVFRAFAHATSTLNRSNFTSGTTPLECSTLSCSHNEGCTYTQGYWKTHGPVPKGNNDYVWPDAVKTNGLTLGTVNYTADQLLSIFNTPASGNGLIALSHQLIAAKLNVANGSGTTISVTVGSTVYTNVNDLIAAADALIGNKIVPPVGNGMIKPVDSAGLNDALSKYNEGATGPGHCD